MFDYLDYKNKIPLEKCLIDIPKINPLSMNYEKFWIHEVKRKQIEGHWVEHNKEYKWIPGVIVQYCNLFKIERKSTTGSAKGKVIDKPDLRDIEWIKGYVYSVARGFSGFSDDDEYTCHRVMLSEDVETLIQFLPKNVWASLYNKSGKLKKYKNALEYLYTYFDRNLGKPLFYNAAKNVIEIGARNYGKTMFSANICAHNFLTDGVTDFDEWYTTYFTKSKDERTVYTTQTLISAIDAKYVNNLTKHLKIGLDNLPGSAQVADKLYPPPLSKSYMGSWMVGKNIEARYQEKVGGKWEWKGTGSSFAMRSFNDNPFAANGLRYGLGLIDEIGFMGNLLDTLGQLHECTTVDGEKYGTIWMTGTGGDMVSGATEAAMKVFYDGEAFDCLTFDDIFENKGKIGLFIPAWMTLSEYRDSLGNVNKELAIQKLLKEREVAANAKTKDALYSLLQMKPLVPSEAFLVLEGNIFPIGELKEHLGYLESNERYKDLGNTGWMFRDDNKRAYFKVDHTLTPATFPTKESVDPKSAVVIWEEPIANPPYGAYVIGVDPYDQDKAENSVSYGSCFVYKRFISAEQTYHIPVAEYTGRPDFADDFYEQVRRLAEYYNAKVLFENQNTGIKKYFERMMCNYLLHTQPNIIKSISPSSNVNRQYGIHMSKPIKDELEIMTRDWLKTELEPGVMQLTKISSIPLLKELIAYDGERNTDRAIAFMLCILQDTEMHRIRVQEKQEIKRDDFFNRKLFN